MRMPTYEQTTNRQQRVRTAYNDEARRCAASCADLGLDLFRSAGALAGQLLDISNSPLAETPSADTADLLDECLEKICAIANAFGLVLDL